MNSWNLKLEKIPFIIASRNEQLSHNLTKYAQDLNMKTYKNLMKELKERPSKWRNIPCSCIFKA